MTEGNDLGVAGFFLLVSQGVLTRTALGLVNQGELTWMALGLPAYGY